MLFCPIPWCTDPMEEEYSTIKKKQENDDDDDAAAVPQTPLVEKVKETILATPATEASTPGETASTTPTAESFSSSDDSVSTSSEGTSEKVSPIRPQALVFEEPLMEKIEEEKAKTTTTPTARFSPLKFILLAIVYAFFSQSGHLFPKKTIAVDRVIESPTIETATIDIEETAVDVDVDSDGVDFAEVDIDANAETEEAEAIE